MELSSRRFLLLAAVLVLVALVSSGRFTSSSLIPSLAQQAAAASSDANVAFEPPDVNGRPSKAPPVLLAGEVSHGRPIWPDLPTPRPNGYCVTVNTSKVLVPLEAPLPNRVVKGFSVKPGTGLAANVPAPSRQNPQIVEDVGIVPVALQHSPMKTPDLTATQYCAQIVAPVGYLSVIISWSYSIDNALQPPISIEIPVVNVTLSYTDGRFGGPTPEPARVCTEGWGWDPGNAPLGGGQLPFFLTGGESMEAGAIEANVVVTNVNPVLSDWDWTGAATLKAPPGIDYYELHSSPLVLNDPPENSVRTDHFEHCIGLAGTAVGASQVTFQFGSIFQPGVISEAIPPVISETEPATVLFLNDATRRFRNIGPSGQMIVPEMKKPGFVLPMPDILRKVFVQDNMVRGAINTACVTQTDAGSGVAVANFAGAIAPQVVIADASMPDLQGAACLQWTSDIPAVQVVSYGGSSEDNNVAVRWNNLHFTELTDSQFQGKNIVTNANLTRALTFNLGNGTFTSAPLNVAEWVYGDLAPKAVAPASEPHPKAVSTSPAAGDRLITGAVITATISSSCGTFNGTSKVIKGVSVWGRFEITDPEDGNKTIDDLRLSITNDTACGASSTITIRVDVFYPGQLTTPATAPETLTISFTFSVPSKSPRFAWAGQQVTIKYEVSAANGACAGAFVKFIRATGQPGSFLPGPGITLNGAAEAVVNFGSCSASVIYESEDPGEVDVEAFIQADANTPALANAGAYSKIAFPVYFMVFEDVTITSTPTSIVSTLGDVSADVRGYFVGTNPSGRASETKSDGRNVPANRWVLPTDYELLRGYGEFRNSWPSSMPMPAAQVTFLIQNESVANNYKTGVNTGGAGWFQADDETDSHYNINPTTNQPSVLGSVFRPRIMSQLSDTSAKASVDTFGDLNLTYEGCAKSPVNGNAHCKPDDVAGHTTYYTTTDYPFAQRKFPPVISNNATTEWTWFGYKQVTVVNTDDPQIKYVVAHLRDRDGYCDAYAFNNVLGVQVRFDIDAGGGTIIDAADRPYTVSPNRRFAVANTFDILDDLQQPINTELAKTALSNDECQAWIRITNSLMSPTNVIVTFPPPPSPVPGNIRVTGLSCNSPELITVTNQGSSLVSLAGYSLHSPASQFAPFEYLGLRGHLQPGQSMTFTGGPLATQRGWLFVSGGNGDMVFNAAADWVELVWDGMVIDRVFCDGRPSMHYDVPPNFRAELEGELILDITIPFGVEKAVALDSGWNLVTAGGTDTVIKDALAGYEEKVLGIYLWDPVKEVWGRYIVGAPDPVNTISKFEKGKVYWVQVKQPFTMLLLK